MNVTKKSTTTPQASEHTSPRDMALRLKDGIREVRFAARQSARQLASQFIETGALAPAWAPPLGQVARIAVGAAEGLDRLAVQLVSSSNDYRAMRFRLLSAELLAENSMADQQALPPTRHDEHSFERYFYWVMKHLLKAAQRDDVTVREEAMHRTRLQFQKAVTTWRSQAQGERRSPIHARAHHVAAIAIALHEQQPLHVHIGAGGSSETAQAETADGKGDLLLCLAMAAAMAAEIAATYPVAVIQDETANALQLALQIARSRQTEFARALKARDPLKSLSKEMAFVLRHI